MAHSGATNICIAARRIVMKAEISWDLVMSEDMGFAEGCYRLEGGDWQVITSWKAGDLWPVGVRNAVHWDSGVTGMNIVFADDDQINASRLLQIMSEVLGVSQWCEVRGPDSMQLR